MRKRRILSLLLAVAVTATMLIAVPLTASASSASDLVAIDENTTLYADTWTVNGTTGMTSGTLYDSDHILSIGGNTAKNDQGKMDETHSYSCRLKGTQNALAFKVNDGAHVKVYNASKSDRCVVASTVAPSESSFIDKKLGYSAKSTTSFEFDAKTGGVIYLTSCVCTYAETGDSLTAPGSSADFYIAAIEVSYAASEPTISLNYKDVKLATGNTITLTPSFELMEGISAENVEWESDHSDYASVVGGVVTGEAPGSAVITAKVNYQSNDYTAKCNVTVANAIDLTLLFDKGVSQVKIKSSDGGGKEYTVTPASPKIEDLPFGEYNLEYTNGAPVTFDISKLPPTLTVNKDTSTTLSVGADYHKTTNDFSEEIYGAMKGHTVFWGSSSNKWVPSSMANLNLIQQKEIVPIAGSIDNATEDSNVYMTVQNGKLDFSGRTGNFQYGADTKLTIPVVPGSVITVINYKNDQSDNHNTVYTITDSTGASETVGTMSADGQKEESYVYNKEYVYQGAMNGYVTITPVKNGDGYLTSIAVDATANPKDYFGAGLTDSGWYQGESGKEGVIRFLQKYVGNSKVDSYGIYFIDPKSDIEKAKISGSGEDLTDSGIYADLYGIPENNEETYSAKAFVVIDGKPIWSDSFSGKVSDWESDANKIDEYPVGE